MSFCVVSGREFFGVNLTRAEADRVVEANTARFADRSKQPPCVAVGKSMIVIPMTDAIQASVDAEFARTLRTLA